jgi:hypothetical protein
MVALIGFYSVFHVIFSVVGHVSRHIMGCVGVLPVC